ncbi:MAG: ABC transporter permease [Bryobacteraceae bacterium]
MRFLRRSPGFSLTIILTVAAAVGMATSVFSVLNAVLLRPLPYKDPARLASIWSASKSANRDPVSFDDFEDWRRNSKTLESAAMYSSYYQPVLSGGGAAERLTGLRVSHQYFAVMSARPWLGRFFLPEEDREGPDNVVVLSYDLWRNRFHADPAVVGRSILLNSRPHTIVGVAGPDLLPLPASLAGDPAQIYRPVGEPFGPGSRDGRHLETIVRLRGGVSIGAAQAELNVRSRQTEREHPKVDRDLNARIVSLHGDITRNLRTPLFALQSAVLMLVLIACANIANLLLAKSSARRREIAIRQALGASTARIVRMLLSESLVLGILGGLCGLFLAVWGNAALTIFAARVLPDAGPMSLDLRVLAFAFALSLLSATLFGLAPAFRLSSGHLEGALKTGGRIAGDRRSVLRQSLAAAQISLALVLVVSTGLLAMSFLRLRGVNPGFDPQSVIAASVALPQVRYPNEEASSRFFDQALARLQATPGVQLASMVSVVPMSGDFDRTAFDIAGKQFGPDKQESPDRYIVGPDYFRALRIPLRQGRVFDNRDGRTQPPVCIVNEAAARAWFGGESPLGHKIRAGSESGNYDDSPFREVVGVVGDVAQYGLGLPPTLQIYMPHAQYAGRYMTLLVRTAGDPSAFSATLRNAVLSVDPEQPVYDVKPLDRIVSSTIAARGLGISVLAVFAFCALALAAVGIYAVVSYSVARRTTEFGVRMALGARPEDIIRKAIGDSIAMIAAGVTCGIAASFAASRLIAGFLYGVSATDATAFAVLPLFLALVALTASYIPARRASRTDPVAALRAE